MARSDPFDGLTEFLAIARCGSLRAAARELGVTPGAVSQALQQLERRLGLPLFHRTTRRLALTEAGERLFVDVAPAAGRITGALDGLAGTRDQPSGTLRLLVHRLAMGEVMEKVLPRFRAAYPAIRLDVMLDQHQTDLVEGGFDAGIRIGEYIDRDMVALRVSPLFDWMVVAAPAYLDARGRPQRIEDLAGHDCIRYRLPPDEAVYRWEFLRDGEALSIDPPGDITVNDGPLLRSLAVAGLGLVYTSSIMVRQELADGRLEQVLSGVMPAREGLYLYFPHSSRAQPKLRAFVETVGPLAR